MYLALLLEVVQVALQLVDLLRVHSSFLGTLFQFCLQFGDSCLGTKNQNVSAKHFQRRVNRSSPCRTPQEPYKHAGPKWTKLNVSIFRFFTTCLKNLGHQEMRFKCSTQCYLQFTNLQDKCKAGRVGMRGKTETDKHNTQVSQKTRTQQRHVSSVNSCI